MAEAWLSGPVPGVTPELQPIAHALLNASEQIRAALDGLTPLELVARPNGVASIAFHVTHAMGSLDRLFTYARGESLSATQREALAAEKLANDAAAGSGQLVNAFDAAVERAIQQLRSTDVSTLLDDRSVGRAKLPSTVIGLLFHGAEHTARHGGQIVTTAKLVRESNGARSRDALPGAADPA